MKLEEALKKITELLHVIAVYVDVLEYLEEYLPSDFDEDEEMDNITVSEPCLNPVVGPESIDKVHENISALKEEAVKQLNALRKLETKNDSKRAKPSTKRAASGRKPSKPSKQS